jgi:hypothetical protein
MLSISSLLIVICLLGGLYRRIDGVNAQNSNSSRPRLSPTPAPAAEELNKLIVMIRCQIADDDSIGAGIIFGKGASRLYIATANHVVRRNTDEAKKVRVQLKWLPGEWKTAELLDSTNRDLDLAVLAIDLSRESVPADALDWNQLGDPGLLKSGDSVFSIGYPNGEAWRIFETPNKIYKKTGASIIFETALIAPGNSGGALLNERREIVGMIREVDSSDGKAVGIQSVIETLKEWTYPVDLKLRSAGGSKTTDATLDKPSEPNAIYNFRARDVSDVELAVTVDYQHAAGESPTDRVTLGAFVVGNDGSPIRELNYSAASQAVKVGGGSATLTIRKETRKTFTSAIVRMSMVKEPRSVLVIQDFPYSKVWGSSMTREGDEPVLRLDKSSFMLPDDGVSTSPRDTDLWPGACCRVVSIWSSNRTPVGRIYLWDASKASGDPDSHVSHGYQLQLWALQDLTNPNSELVSKYYNAFPERKPAGTEESVELGGLRFLFRLLTAHHVPQRGESVFYLNSVRIQVEVSPIPSNQMKRP